MANLEGSVGTQGANLSSDVRTVQQRLNRYDLSPLAPLAEDGRNSAALETAIRHFQTRYVGLHSPDGRIDPGGRSWRRLTSGSPTRSSASSAETRQADRSQRQQFVDPRVKETELTRTIIDRLLPHLHNIRAKIISGYLSDADLFWKVNYHWEYLLDMVNHSLALPLEKNRKEQLANLRSSLLACQPSPASGYTSGALGKPIDSSSATAFSARHKVLSSAKRTFAKLITDAGLKNLSKRSSQAFDLAAAPVAQPGSSKHGSGYALDIQGDNNAIKSICNARGASLVFDEKSHVHVEFKNGVA